jgi:hypothetical protein
MTSDNNDNQTFEKIKSISKQLADQYGSTIVIEIMAWCIGHPNSTHEHYPKSQITVYRLYRATKDKKNWSGKKFKSLKELEEFANRNNALSDKNWKDITGKV